MRGILLLVLLYSFCFSSAQTLLIGGRIEDTRTHEALVDVSIILFQNGGIRGGVSNREGRFEIPCDHLPDSIRFSMIGYQARVLKAGEIHSAQQMTIGLNQLPGNLESVTVFPLRAIDIIRKTAAAIPAQIPSANFESEGFYREIIQDSHTYFSLAEAIFKIQFAAEKEKFRLQLIKGRTKEDITYTRLFEDYHPGGGPNETVSQSLSVNTPSFLKEENFKKYIFEKDSVIQQDSHTIYVIRMDQSPDVHEAMEKGRIWVNGSDFSLLKYELYNSPRGTPYIKSLHGTDKLFADLLNIDLRVKGWSRTATFTQIGGKVYLSYARMSYQIDYKQPKKNLDLHLSIRTELMITDFNRPIESEISKDQEWKRKNMAANLPKDFDPEFWGNRPVISPDQEIQQIIATLSVKNQDADTGQALQGWNILNRDYFFAVEKTDSVILVPLTRSNWEDEEQGGMIYKNLTGDFTLEAKLSISQRSNLLKEPENGFQQAGLIIRKRDMGKENDFIFSLGNGGNDKPKYFLKRTTNGKTSNRAEKMTHLSASIRLEKKGMHLTAWMKPDGSAGWTKLEEYELNWLSGELQVGFSIMARFAGDGPKQKPDMRAVFSAIRLY